MDPSWIAPANLLPAMIGATVAGLTGSPHCVGMCGGFALAASQTTGGTLAWTLGRLFTYAVLGAIAGSVGGLVPGPGWVGSAVAAALLIWFALRLAGIGPAANASFPVLTRWASALLRRAGLPSRFAFGAVNGLLPCGLVYAALSFPVAVRNPLQGALVMLLFGLGTTPAIAVAVLGLRRLAANSLMARRALAVLVLVSGLGALALRADTHAPGEMHLTDTDPDCH